MAPHGGLCSGFRARTFVRAHGRHAIVTPRARPPPACCADGFLWLSSRAFWRPGGWESMCRLMCHCVRHISLDNKHGRSVEAIYSSRHAGRLARSSVPAHRKSRAARRARWGARTVKGAHAGFGRPSWCGQFPPGLTAQVPKLVEHS